MPEKVARHLLPRRLLVLLEPSPLLVKQLHKSMNSLPTQLHHLLEAVTSSMPVWLVNKPCYDFISFSFLFSNGILVSTENNCILWVGRFYC
jgi:hypothetical protein